jgi:small subunit ribosomal protein S16
VTVRIRMKMMGRKHRPFYRICIMDSRSPRDGKAIEEVGYYDTTVQTKADRVKMDMERVDYWLSVGAKPSEKVAALIKKVKTNKFGSASAPPPLTPPKEKPAPQAEAAAEAPAEETAEAPAE